MQNLLKVQDEDIQLADQCYSRPMAEVAVQVTVASSLICIAHTRHMLLAAIDEEFTAPWVTGLMEGPDLTEPMDAVLAYTAWIRSLALGHTTASPYSATIESFDHVLHGLAYVEILAKGQSLQPLTTTSAPLEAIYGAMVVIATTVRMHAAATGRPWAVACEQLLQLP